MGLGVLRLPGGLDYSKYGRIPQLLGIADDKQNHAFLNASFVSTENFKSTNDVNEKPPFRRQLSQSKSRFFDRVHAFTFNYHFQQTVSIV